ncbi:hypothetical protein CGJ94_24570, partial [Vibrio parahaemolyticus]
MNESVFTIVGISLALMIGFTFAVWQFMAVLVEILKARNDKKLKDDIANALKNGEPTWEQVKTIESCYAVL